MLSACSASFSSWWLSSWAWLPIHTTMVVTKTTATSPMTVSMPSWAACGRLFSTRLRLTPTARLTSTAAATPIAIGTSDLPLRRRKAAMMLTMSAASRPSRSPMMNVASTVFPQVINQFGELWSIPSTSDS